MRTTTEKNNGWFKVERSQWESDVLRDNEERYAWADLLFLCNYKDEDIFLKKTQKSIKVCAGQLFTSTRHLARRWGWRNAKVDRFILRLKRVNWIDIDRGTNGTIVTILKSGDRAIVRDTDRDTERGINRDTDRCTDRGTNRGTNRGRIKNINTDKNINNSQDPKNAAKRSGFVWGEDE